jgi:hypothetical protein
MGILPISNLEDGDRQGIVVNEVNDSIVSLPTTVSVGVAGQLIRTVWPRVRREPLNSGDNPLAICL